MAALVLAAGGAAMGTAMGWGMLGMTGAQVGWMAGTILGNVLFPPEGMDVQGPRLSDLKVQVSTYGTMIPIVYGSSRIAGNVIWSTDLVETAHTQTVGGKGGGGESTQTNYTYSASCAVAVCEGPVAGIRRIWANSELIYDNTTQPSGITIYTGSETQTASALIESHEGAGNVPAHRGLVYVTFENFQLERYGNRIPSFSFEVAQASGEYTMTLINIGAGAYNLQDAVGNADYLWISDFNFGRIIKLNKTTQAVTYISVLDGSSYLGNPSFPLLLVGDEVWAVVTAGNPTTRRAYKISATSDSILGYATLPATGFCIVAAGDHVLVGCSNSSVKKILRADCSIVSSITLGGATEGFDSIVYLESANHAYAITTGGNVVAINVTDMTATWTTAVGYGYSIAVDGDFLWVVDCTNNALAKINRTTGSVISSTSIINGYYGGYSYQNIVVTNSAIWFNNDSRYVTRVDRTSLAVTHHAVYPDKDIQYDGIYIWCSGAMNISGVWHYGIFAISESTNTVAFHIEWDGGLYHWPTAVAFNLSGGKLWAAVNEWPNNGWAAHINGSTGCVPVALSSIVSDICQRAGLSSADVNVTPLTDMVDGYVIGQQMTARAAIEPLQTAYFFDATEG